MKATKTNKQNRAKRALVSILAAISMMTATVPAAASAAMITSDTPAAVAVMNTEFSEADFEAMISNMSLEQILNEWANINTDAAAAKKGTETEIEEKAKEDDFYDPIAAAMKKYIKKQFKQGVEKFIASAPAPMNMLMKEPVGSLINMALGDNKKETSNDDVIKAIEKQTAEIQAQLAKIEKEIIQATKDTSSSTSYGGVMDNFTSAAKSARTEIQGYLDDRSLTDNERAVKATALLKEKDLVNLMNRVTLVMNDVPDTDENGRNMFQVAYDIFKKQSLFSGEALDKSQSYVLKRVNTYMQNCLAVLEVMKAQQRVTEFTPDEVAALKPDVRKIYDTFTCSQYDAKRAISNLISQLVKSDEANNAAKAEHKEGILNMTKDYFSQDRFIYIGKGNANIPLKREMNCYAGVDFGKSPTYASFNDSFFWKTVNNSLPDTAVDLIARQAKEEKKTIFQYLESIGFDTCSQYCAGRAPLLLTGGKYDTYGGGTGWGDEGVYGYRMDVADYNLKDRGLVHTNTFSWTDKVWYINEKKFLAHVVFVRK